MYIDPEGESLALLLIFLMSVMFFGTTIALTPAENRPLENFTASFAASPDPYAFGAEAFGVGYNAQIVPQGTTCNLYGECYEYVAANGQVSIYGANFSSSKGEDSLSFSVSVFYFSFNPENFFDTSSWSGGVSVGASGGMPYVGSGSVSIDIDFIGLIRDMIGG